MNTRFRWFNVYLLLAIILSACATDGAKGKKNGRTKEEKKELAAIRFHLESFPDGTGHNGPVLVMQQKINVDREPFLSEADIVDAAVVENVGGFGVQIFFDSHGAMLLDMTTTSNKGKRIVVLTQYPNPKPQKQFSRWVAAPMITKRVANGVLAFTPDLSREEANRIVRGLKNVVLKAQKASRF